MHSQFGLPLGSLSSQVPIIAQTVRNHISLGTHLGRAYRNTSVVERFDLVLGLVVPEVHATVRACSHEPTIVDWVEAHRVYRIEDCISALLLLVALECYHRFLYRQRCTGAKRPLTFLLMLERLALPSKLAIPNIVHFWLMATDCIWENFPRSVDSTTDLVLGLLISTSMIFSLAVPATSMGNWKSLVNTLFSALKVITGLGFPTCQNWMLFSQPLETMVFMLGTKCSELMAALCLPTSATCPLLTSQTLMAPSMRPTQIWVLWSFQVHLRTGCWKLQLSFWIIALPQAEAVTSKMRSSPFQAVEAKTLGMLGAHEMLEKESLKGWTEASGLMSLLQSSLALVSWFTPSKLILYYERGNSQIYLKYHIIDRFDQSLNAQSLNYIQ